MTLFRRIPPCVWLAVWFLLFTTQSPAQQGGGIISGIAADATGASIPHAGLTITNVDTGAVIRLETNGAGNYTTPSLQLGTYSVKIEARGFQSMQRSGVHLAVDSQTLVNFTMIVGTVSDSIIVSTQTSAINQTTATLGTTVEAQAIEELPINGRSVLALTQQSPGVHQNSGSVNEGFADRGTAVSAISVNNSPNAMNAMILDGQNDLQTYYPEVSLNPTADAIQEFKIETATMPAEYGFTAGGVVNMVSKSGTSKYHGSIYEFFRNDYLNARNYFVPAPSRVPELRYNQYGGSVGGAILKDKLTFFSNFEGYQYVTSSSVITTVPTTAQRAGDFSQTFDTNGNLIPIYDPNTTVVNPKGAGYVRTQYSGNKIPQAQLDPVALAIQAYYPLPNHTPSNAFTNSNNFQALSPSHKWMAQALGRADYSLSSRHSMFLRYGYYLQYQDNGGNIYMLNAPVLGARDDHDITNSLLWTDTFILSPNVINELRLSVLRSTLDFSARSANQGWPQKLGLPSNVPGTTPPYISGNGFPGFNTTVGLRTATNPEVSDILTVAKGKHNIRTGFDWRLNVGSNQQTSYPSGLFSFASTLTGNPQSQSGTGSAYASFLAGAVTSASEVISLGEVERNYSITGFADDVWKALPNLVLSFGLRYDLQQYPHEKNGGSSNFNPNIVDSVNGLQGAIVYAGVNGAPTTFRNTDRTNLSPRIAFNWDVFGHGTTAFRGGYGIYYPSIFSGPFFGSTQGFGTTSTAYSTSNANIPAFYLKGGFPYAPTQPLGAQLGPAAFLGSAVTYDPQSDGTTPMSQQWNLSIQRALPKQITLDVAYVGNHGTHFIESGRNINQLDPKYLALGLSLQDQVTNPYAGKVPGSLGNPTISRLQSLLAFPYYTTVSVRNAHAGDYIGHSLNISATRQGHGGLTLIVAYTKSKLIDDGIVTPVNYGTVTQAGVIGFQNAYDPRAERAVDPLDLSQFLNVSALYALPFGHDKHFLATASPLVNALVGGWQINGNATWHTGLPLAVSGANNNSTATRPNFVPGVSAKLPHPTISKWFNTAAFINPPIYTYGNVSRTLPNVRGPGVFVMDLSLFKTVKLFERLDAQFRAEAFNALNHPNFGLPSTGFSPGSNGLNASSTFGTITSAADGRALQLAVKLMF